MNFFFNIQFSYVLIQNKKKIDLNLVILRNNLFIISFILDKQNR